MGPQPRACPKARTSFEALTIAARVQLLIETEYACGVYPSHTSDFGFTMRFAARSLAVSIVVLVWATSLLAQSSNKTTVLNVFAVLTTPVDTTTAVRGDEIFLTTLNDLIVDGKIVLPKGSKIVGHVGAVAIKGKNKPKSVLALSIDRGARNNGADLPLHAIIAAIAAPRIDPAMTKSASETSPTRDNSSSSAHVTAGRIELSDGQAPLLTEKSQGAAGYKGVAISWYLTAPPPLTIFAINAKVLRLESGTQMFLRVMPVSAP